MRRHFFLFMTILFTSLGVNAQKVSVEGYVFEDGNRGYLNEVNITILEKETKALKTKAITNRKGVFLAEVEPGKEYIFRADKKVFEKSETIVSTVGKTPGDKVYVKIKMVRKPGYRFEVTIANHRDDNETPVDAIHGSRVEVYNNTTKKESLVIEKLETPTFHCNFEQGNHYTLMIRKEGYFIKRMEAYVNVKGCILCFDGVGEVTPGQPRVSDVLTEGNKMGTLLANVELMAINMNEGIEIDNLYYNYNSARIKTASRKELDKLTVVLNDNPSLLVELGSHTDSRGKDSYNMSLSKKRAKSAVDYLVKKGVDKKRVIAKGYGETELTNKCGNNSKCTEKEHAKNRRTELKVVGYLAQNLQEDKTLVEIKEAEAFEEMLKEIQNQEVIKVENPDELPDEIKKQLDKQESGETDTKVEEIKKSDISDTTTLDIVETVVEEVKTEVKEKVPTPAEKTTVIERLEDFKKEENPVSNSVLTPPRPEKLPTKITAPTKTEKVEMTEPEISTPVVENPVSNSVLTPPKPEKLPTKITVPTNTENVEMTEPETSIPAVEKPTMEEPVVRVADMVDNETEDFESDFEKIDEELSDRIIMDKEINTSSGIERAPHLLAMEYTGFMVQFFTSPYELPASHEIFSRHGNITVDQTKDGTYAYLLGDFSNEDDASNFLNSIMKTRYAKARVIQFKRGNRMN